MSSTLRRWVHIVKEWIVDDVHPFDRKHYEPGVCHRCKRVAVVEMVSQRCKRCDADVRARYRKQNR